MQDSVNCGNCGIWVHCFLRHCPACGEPLFLSVEEGIARPEMFFDLMTSLFNLVANRENARRARYFPPLSEDIIIRRCEVEFPNEVRSLELGGRPEEEWPDEIRDLFAMSLTNTLTGYIYRSVEELVTKKKSPELRPEEKNFIFSILDSDVAAIGQSCYRGLDRRDFVDWRVLFCLALRISGVFSRYTLAGRERQEEWYLNILDQSRDRTRHFYEIAFKAVWPRKNSREFLNRQEGLIRENVEKDLLFGYVVKLGESLNPYREQAPIRLH